IAQMKARNPNRAADPWWDYDPNPPHQPPRGGETPIKTYQCPSDAGLANGIDAGYTNLNMYGPYTVPFAGTSYDVNAFASRSSIPTGSPPIPPQVNLVNFSRIPASFSDGTSNTILFTEKLSTCGLCTPGSEGPTCGGSLWASPGWGGGENWLPIVGVVGPPWNSDVWRVTFQATSVLNASPLYPSAPLIC